MTGDLLTRLASLPTAALSDVMRKMGLDPGTMHSSMKPVWEGAQVCGPAFTVRTYPGATHGCDLALAQAAPGDVVVLAGGGYTESILWGEIYSTAARQRRLGGTVIDGAARDLRGIAQVGYPVFARAVTPRGGTFDDRQSQAQVPVSCAGLVVRPGDLVRGDEVGVVVVPIERAAEIIDQSVAVTRREARIVELLLEGAALDAAVRICTDEGW
jgi:regulator of RNase E activity RraA